MTEVLATDEFRDWYRGLPDAEVDTVTVSVERLEQLGIALLPRGGAESGGDLGAIPGSDEGVAMEVHRWDELKRERVSEERLAEIKAQVEQEVLEMNLAAMRELAGKTQVEVADAMGSTQSEVSRSERREDHLVSTLRHYVRALGGELELTARFGDKSVRLRGV